MANMHTVTQEEQFVASEPTPINIGATIRDFRLQRGMSQGDIEKRTGLLDKCLGEPGSAQDRRGADPKFFQSLKSTA